MFDKVFKDKRILILSIILVCVAIYYIYTIFMVKMEEAKLADNAIVPDVVDETHPEIPVSTNTILEEKQPTYLRNQMDSSIQSLFSNSSVAPLNQGSTFEPFVEKMETPKNKTNNSPLTIAVHNF